jgi:hypothetical protein
MAPDPVSTSRTDARGESRPGALWHKLGTIERLIRHHGGADGTPSLAEKGVCVIMLTYATTSSADPKVTVGEQRVADELGIDAKTLRRHVKKLERRRWVEVKRDRPHGGVTYYIAGLVESFRDDAPPRQDSKVISIVGQTRQDARTKGIVESVSRPGILSARPGDLSASPGILSDSDRASCPPDRAERPVSLEHVQLERNLIGTSPEHTALARRLGVDQNFFEHRPRRFAAAHLVAARLTEWGVNEGDGKRRDRQLRKVIADYGFVAVAGAVGYVLGEIERSSQALLIGDEAVRSRAALFYSALHRDWSGAIPGFEDDPYSPRAGGASVDADLWDYVRALLDRRVPSHTLEVGFAHAKLRSADGAFTVILRDAFAATIARKASDKVCWALEFIGYPNATVSFESEGA